MKRALLAYLAIGFLALAGCATGYGERESGMSLGMGIFLSSLILGPIALVIGTKDRWNWKKIILWPLAGLILIALGLWIYNRIEQRPKVQTSFWDIPLGASQADVRFLKGEPTGMGEGKGQEDAWEYVFNDSTEKQWDYVYRIRFKSGKVWLIEYFASSNRSYGPGIQGIDIRDPLEKISDKFGPSPRFSVSKDELSRVFSFVKYQVAFELKENRVVGYGVFDSSVAPKGVGY